MSSTFAGFVYLASQSPRRSELLGQLGIAHRLLLPDPAEDAEALETALPGEAPARYVRRVTLLKLHAARARLAGRGWPLAPILCADTTVALGRQILGKPRDDAHARQMLRQLSGATHRVLSAVAIAWGAQDDCRVSVSQVRMARWTASEIRAYVATGESRGKAGAYAVQGRAAAYIEHITGSYSGIMGLPLYDTCVLLRDIAGWNLDTAS